MSDEALNNKRHPLIEQMENLLRKDGYQPIVLMAQKEGGPRIVMYCGAFRNEGYLDNFYKIIDEDLKDNKDIERAEEWIDKTLGRNT